MKINYLLLFAALWLGLNTAQAQRQAGDYGLRGTISDSLTNNPIDFITVNLMKSQTEVHKVDYTKNDGSFSFTGVEKGNYHLAIIGVGYKTLMVKVDLTDSTQKTLELGKLILRPDVIGLKEVVVTTLKPIVTQEVDRIVYDMQADPESKVLTVLDMMRKVPMLSLDAENNILMKGNSDFKILINGRPSSMMERSYKDILRSMPASSIERIEVITSPPAKYDAEGLAGIINIITNKKLDNGYNGTLNVSERFPAGGPGIGGSLNVKIGKFGISSFGGANIYNNPVTTNTTKRATSGAYPTFLKQEGTNRSDSKNGYLGIELSYEIDSLNLISGQFNINGNDYTDVPYQWSALMRSGELVQGFKINGRNTGQGNGLDMALNYQKGFRSNKNRLLTFSYRSVSYNNNQFVNTTITEKIDSDLLDYRQSNDQYFGEQTVQVDYVHPWKKLTLETGLKGIMRNNNSDFQYLQLDPETGDYVLQDGRSNRFRNRQDVYGAYTSFQYNLKKWSLKAGARIEETVIHADFITTESALNRTYFNVIPSVALSRKLKDNRGLNITFNQRIQRPGIYQLNPFVDRSNPNFETTGNPNLKPSVVNDVRIGYSSPKKLSLNINLGYNFFQDLIFRVAVFDPETNITRTSYGNTGSARLPMMDMSMGYPISKNWNFNMNGRVAYGMVRGTVDGKLIKNQGFMYRISVSTGYKLPKEWRVNANFNYNGPNLQFQGTSNSMFYSSASVSKDVIKDKLSFSASISNPFNKFRTRYNETFGPDFQQDNYYREYYRSVNVSLNYKFGKLKESIKKAKRSIRNDDVQNGN